MCHEKHCAFMAALDAVIVMDFPLIFAKPTPPPA
jgi:hypothetical protein